MEWPQFIKDHFNQKVPFLRYMGIEVIETKKGYAKIKIPLKKEFANSYGIAHGGICALLVDTVIGISLRTLKHKVLTLETTTSYFKPAQVTDILYAVGEVTHQGKKILHAKAEIINQKEEIIGEGKAIYYVTGEDDGIYE